MTGPGKRPSAITGYESMHGYAAATAMFAALRVTGRRIRDRRYGLDRVLYDRSLATLLATAEAGARVEPERRTRYYRTAWLGTSQCDSILDAAASLRLIRPELLMGAQATVRQTQQAVTIAAGVMARRRQRPRGFSD